MPHQDYSKTNAAAFSWSAGNLYEINPAVNKSLKHFKGLNLVEVGCGHGDYSTLAAKYQLNYTGIDNSPYMLQIACKRYPQETFILADAKKLSGVLTKKKFHVVLSVMMLASTKNNQKLL